MEISILFVVFWVISKKHKFELRSFVKKKKISNIIMIMAVMNKTSFRAGYYAKILESIKI